MIDLTKNGIADAKVSRANSKRGLFKFMESLSNQILGTSLEGRSSYKANFEGVATEDINAILKALEAAGYRVEAQFPHTVIDWSDA